MTLFDRAVRSEPTVEGRGVVTRQGLLAQGVAANPLVGPATYLAHSGTHTAKGQAHIERSCYEWAEEALAMAEEAGACEGEDLRRPRTKGRACATPLSALVAQLERGWTPSDEKRSATNNGVGGNTSFNVTASQHKTAAAPNAYRPPSEVSAAQEARVARLRAASATKAQARKELRKKKRIKVKVKALKAKTAAKPSAAASTGPTALLSATAPPPAARDVRLLEERLRRSMHGDEAKAGAEGIGRAGGRWDDIRITRDEVRDMEANLRQQIAALDEQLEMLQMAVLPPKAAIARVDKMDRQTMTEEPGLKEQLQEEQCVLAKWAESKAAWEESKVSWDEKEKDDEEQKEPEASSSTAKAGAKSSFSPVVNAVRDIVSEIAKKPSSFRKRVASSSTLQKKSNSKKPDAACSSIATDVATTA